MISSPDLLQQGAAHAWLFIPTAVMLGALHGLEPGHSKTMMAAFIVAIRGTVRQAVMLGLAATVSHTAVVWIVALGGMSLFGGLNAEATEPYFKFASGLLIVGIAVWMILRTRSERPVHGHSHGHDRSHDNDDGHYRHDSMEGLNVVDGEYVDAHERVHAEDIRRHFTDRNVTAGQIIMFGLTGGLIPCPGAITVLLLCLQLNRLILGGVLVVSFSIGLAITMVLSGVIAALSVRHISRRSPGFGEIVRKAPYVSGVVILIVGAYIALDGWATMPR